RPNQPRAECETGTWHPPSHRSCWASASVRSVVGRSARARRDLATGAGRSRRRWSGSGSGYWWGSRRFLQFMQEAAETLDANLPEALVLDDPVDQRDQAGWFGAVVDEAAGASIGDEPGATQRGQVLRDGGLRDRQAGGNLGDGGFALRQ